MGTPGVISISDVISKQVAASWMDALLLLGQSLLTAPQTECAEEGLQSNQ